MAELQINVPIPAPLAGSVPTDPVTVANLLEDEALHTPRTILRLFGPAEYGNIAFPEDIHVHCDHDKCGGVRRHTHKDSKDFQRGRDTYSFAAYQCTNCTTAMKVFGLKAEKSKNGFTGTCTKIYQEPPFGQPIPKRLFHVIGEANREHFLQARRSIARGLGIGAYAYYRRIVENTKFDLVGSVLEVAQATNALPAAQIELLKKARSETQFSKAIDMLREVSAIPAVLLIEGHNPLLLLHDLLSEGIHQLDERECLERAQQAEVILCEIADRLQIALTERKTVKAAISSIMHRKTAGGKGATAT